MDNLCDFDSVVAVGDGICLYDGRTDPYSARYCYHSGAGTRHSRSKGPVGRAITRPGTSSVQQERAHRDAPFLASQPKRYVDSRTVVILPKFIEGDGIPACAGYHQCFAGCRWSRFFQVDFDAEDASADFSENRSFVAPHSHSTTDFPTSP